MSRDIRTRTQGLRYVPPRLKRAFPRAVRESYFGELQRLCREVGDWPRQSLRMLLGAYKNQIILATNALAIVLHLGAMAYCFSAAGVPIALAIVLGSVLAPLILLGGFTHPFDINGNVCRPLTRWQYAWDSMTDALVTMVTVLFCQCIMLMTVSELAMKPDRLLRGIWLGLPVLTAMRMALRPRPQFHMPFKDSKLTANQIYKRTCWMNFLWIVCFQQLIVSRANFLPDWIPMNDFLSTFIPAKLFVFWVRVQQNPLIRRDKIETLLGTHWAKKLKARQRERLMKGLEKGQQFYYAYIGLQFLIFAWAAIPVGRALWPWLSGDVANRDDYEFWFRLVIWLVMLFAWDYLKRANRAAADAMQQDINSDRIPDEIPIWMRVWNWFA